MADLCNKPRLIFFQFKYDNRLAPFLLTHKQEHIKCLSQFFDVTVISEDCDYKQICDTYEPALALFESGVNHETCRRLRIKNARSYAQVPKLGLHHADAFCNARAGFLSDMEHWGIDTFFAITTTAAEHTPDIADRLFTWPVFVDPSTYHDYGIWKSIPILLTGNRNNIYPWRNQLWDRLSNHYGTLTWPHPGYYRGTPAARILMGEQYARTINASWIVPACGTVAKDVVRKHFEVPASRACLVTERSPALESAGFVDMQNCVFADANDALDKLDYLFRNRDVLTTITDAGYRLAHSRHTIEHRNQIYQWFRLRTSLRAHETIVQPGPFEPLTVVSKKPSAQSIHVASGGLHLDWLRKGDAHFGEGERDDAEQCYLKCACYMPWMPEPKLRLALCKLYKGQSDSALSLIEKQLTFVLQVYGAEDPDPVEWACYLITLLCLGKIDAARRRAEMYPALCHPQLELARRAVMLLSKRGSEAQPCATVDSRCRPSIHRLPIPTTGDWVEQICAMLKACKQPAMADLLMERWRSADCNCEPPSVPRNAYVSHAVEKRIFRYKRILNRQRMAFKSKAVTSSFAYQLFHSKLAAATSRLAKIALHRLEGRYGYFLPYRLSTSKRDELFRLIGELAQAGNIHTILVLGATLKSPSIEAVLAGAAENANRPYVFCVGASIGKRARQAMDRYAGTAKCVLSAHSSDAFLENIRDIKIERKLNHFDAVLIADCKLSAHLAAADPLRTNLLAATTVVLEGLNHPSKFAIYETLLASSHFELTAQNPDLRNGYAVFAKTATSDHGSFAPDVVLCAD